MTRRFDSLTFRVPNAKACRTFYEEILGMSAMKDDSLGFDSNGLKVRLEDDVANCQVRQSSPSDAFWKIGITVKNLDHAVSYLRCIQGAQVSTPSQFMNVGYLCHLQDPAGISIELLQQGFQGREQEIDSTWEHPIGDQATLAHITVRATNENFGRIQHWCEERKMRLMSIQPVQQYGFSLYFYGWSNEALPNDSDLKAVENRPWLWARPYGLLEIQHNEGPAYPLRATASNEAGPVKLLIADDSGGELEEEVDCQRELGL